MHVKKCAALAVVPEVLGLDVKPCSIVQVGAPQGEGLST